MRDRAKQIIHNHVRTLSNNQLFLFTALKRVLELSNIAVVN